MAGDPRKNPSQPERGIEPGRAVKTLLKIQSQFEEWEQRDRSKRRRNLMMISGSLLAAAAVIALAIALSGRSEPDKPAPAAPAQTGATVPAPAQAKKATATRYVTALTPEPRFAQYAENWRRKIEAAGSADFPDEVRRSNLYGNLVLTTFIRHDGSVERIEVSRSSGHRVLDEAAIRIVRMAAPFEPFTDAIRRDTATLAIVRTFYFERKTTEAGGDSALRK